MNNWIGQSTLELMYTQLKQKNFYLHGLGSLLRGPILMFISFYLSTPWT